MFVNGVEHTHKDSKGASDFMLTHRMRHTQLLRTRDPPQEVTLSPLHKVAFLVMRVS